MAKLTMTTRPDKAQINNSGDKAIGVTLSLDQITKAEPFNSLFMIKPEVLTAITADILANGFDPSKPVNVWKKPDGTRILIDGYTRVRAAEALGLLHVTAYEKSFASEADALAYAIHTQRDRRNLSDAEILRLIDIVDQPQKGFNVPVAAFEATGLRPRKTADITAEAIGTSRAKVERARAVLADPIEAAAVLSGEKTIHQAAQDAKVKRSTKSSAESKSHGRSNAMRMSNEDALAEGHRVLNLLNALATSDPRDSRRAAYKLAATIVRKALR